MAILEIRRIVRCDATIQGEPGQLTLEVIDGGRVRATGGVDVLLEFDAAELADAWAKLFADDTPPEPTPEPEA